MNKLYFFFLAISMSLHPYLHTQPLEQQQCVSFNKKLQSMLSFQQQRLNQVPLSSPKQDVSYCAQRLFEAARHTSDQQASKDMIQVMTECRKKGLSDQVQFANAHTFAVERKDHLASWRLGTESGKKERNYTYHTQTALWTIASATAAVGTCWWTGLCGGKK